MSSADLLILYIFVALVVTVLIIVTIFLIVKFLELCKPRRTKKNKKRKSKVVPISGSQITATMASENPYFIQTTDKNQECWSNVDYDNFSYLRDYSDVEINSLGEIDDIASRKSPNLHCNEIISAFDPSEKNLETETVTNHF